MVLIVDRYDNRKRYRSSSIKAKNKNKIFPFIIKMKNKKKIIASIRDYNTKTRETHIWYEQSDESIKISISIGWHQDSDIECNPIKPVSLINNHKRKNRDYDDSGNGGDYYLFI